MSSGRKRKLSASHEVDVDAKRITRGSLHDYCGIHERSASGSWSYDGALNPSNWYEKYPACSLKSQSPIDIPEGICEGRRGEEAGRGFRLHGLFHKLTVNVVNNGHSIQANLPKDADVSFRIDGTTYIVEQFHFHWGKKGSHKGSEHTIGGKAFPLELHIVAYDKQYKNVAAAADKRGLAVLGFLFKEGKKANKFLNKLVKTVPELELHHGGQKSHPVDGFRFFDLIGEKCLSGGYYRYSGSLTTPPCYEGVVWTVFRDLLSVSRKQMSVFRDKTGIMRNYRPTQPLNGRKVACY